MRREQAQEMKHTPLIFGKDAAFVQERMFQEPLAGERDFRTILAAWITTSLVEHRTAAPFTD